MQLAAVVLAVAVAVPMAAPARAARNDELTLRVGLAYGSNALVSANLENNTGYGSGYRFGYYDSDLDFVELGRTSSSVTKLTMVKAQNIWVSGTSYSTSDNGGELIGCYHVQMPGSYNSYNAAYSEASDYSDGFVAWIDGAYQVRVGAYKTEAEAESRASSLGGTVVGTGSYAVNVTQTGKAKILFQFDGGSSTALGIMPDVTGAGETRTWFKGYRYPGGFRYERVNGGNLTVVNIVDMEDYLIGVVPYEMSDSWPL
ncbi:MAG: sporulation protein SpoIID, partial [Intestinimonas massiliensis]